jgi:acetyl/propionyl-CoA carboxylase alpha subunit
MDRVQSLKMRLGEARIQLALNEIDVRYAQIEYQRVKKLVEEKILKESSSDKNEITLQTVQHDLERASAQLELRKKILAEAEADYEAFAKSGAIKIEPEDPVISQAIKAQQELIKLTEAPQMLLSPITGRVSAIVKRAGEKIVRGEPIVTISAPNSDKVIGYIRQPVKAVPTTNDMVKVRTRSQKRLIADCKIVHVGPSMEPIKPALLSMDVQHAEVGLPILVELPQQMRLIPGEFVDLSIQYAKR